MTTSFYLFDVDHGQCAALRLPNGRWCIFDVGCTHRFSPVGWIAATVSRPPFLLSTPSYNGFRFLKGTISHFHGDHLADYSNLLNYGPEFLRTVEADSEYLTDCYATCSDETGKRMVQGFAQSYLTGFSPATSAADYGGIQIREISLPVSVSRQVGGAANARVNNASVVTRIDAWGNSFLLCGDLEKEAWEFLLAQDLANRVLRVGQGVNADAWRLMVSDVDILIAPHHGHRSGYSVDLLNLAKPSVVLISVTSRDEHVDSRYSGDPVRGLRIGDVDYHYISTRKQGHVRVDITPPANPLMIGARGQRSWAFGDAALAVT